VPHAARDIFDLDIDPQDPNVIYLVTSQGVYVGNLATGQWHERLSAAPSEQRQAEEPEPSEPEATESEGRFSRFSAIAIDDGPPVTLYVASSQGLQRSVDGGITWQPLTHIGLGSAVISRLKLQAHSPLAIYAATSRGVARYEPERERWQLIVPGLAATQVHDLATRPHQLWAATSDGLYRYQIAPDAFGKEEPPPIQELLANFSHEPTIAQVRDAAIRYAEVHPSKIKRWRRQAALQALLPTVGFSLDRDTSRDPHVDEGAFPNFQLIETKDRDVGADLSVKWDLGEMIWNNDQTLIDVRSKLMTQLRDDIVDEVTRTYFERRRLQASLLTNPPIDQQAVLEKELRLQELTALLDGLTGGLFSNSMKRNLN